MNYGYNYKHGITFYIMDREIEGLMYHRSTWEDYKLIPKARPFVAPPPVKTIYLDIPGLDGKLDYTDALLGRPAFGNRSGSWTFIHSGEINIYDSIRQIRNDIDGRLMNIVLQGDPVHYYRGRAQLSSVEANPDGSGTEFTIDYNVSPYKYSVGVMTAPISSDVTANLNVKTILDRNDSDYSRYLYVHDTSEEIHLNNRGPDISGSVYCTGSDMTAIVTNAEESRGSHSLSVGDNLNVFTITSGRNIIGFTGNGRVQLYYAEGRL